ncbi:hypothetical protein MRB53_038488 [Persea americana]|nr:hypothetical protein MRB53_038488 [Persea americana]
MIPSKNSVIIPGCVVSRFSSIIFFPSSLWVVDREQPDGSSARESQRSVFGNRCCGMLSFNTYCRVRKGSHQSSFCAHDRFVASRDLE